MSLEHCLVANNIADPSKKQWCCSVFVDYLTTPILLSEVSYFRIVNHYYPKLSVTVQCFKLNSCYHQLGESISTFVTSLILVIKFCDFHDRINGILLTAKNLLNSPHLLACLLVHFDQPSCF